jgi:DNA invertase Pin-like site-specific DNA recombinase
MPMNENVKIKSSHLGRLACVYLRQSSPSQVEHNRESTDRQYKLKDLACSLGWPADRVTIIDEDLGHTGSGLVDRTGFDRLISSVALGTIGIIVSIEVSRLARNNAEWYRLLDLCGVTDTLIGDSDGIYHPGLFNDRLVLGLKGTMSEAELHIIRARLDGGIRNKAARGQLRRGLPVGFVWGEADGQVLLHPDLSVRNAIHNVFARFDETGSARRVWLWFRSNNLTFPSRASYHGPIRWITPTYTVIHQVLTNPVYAGAYVYGKSRRERYVDEDGKVRKHSKLLPQSQWQVLIPEHHQGYVDWETYQSNQERISRNTHPRPHQAGGAVREGAALLQGLGTCGNCGRKLKVYYGGKNSTPGYYCPGSSIVNGRGLYCMRVGGARIDAAVADAFIKVLTPAKLDVALIAESSLRSEYDAATEQCRLEVQRLGYEATCAERRYRAVDPENRLVASGLEKQWEQSLQKLADAQTDLARRQQLKQRAISADDRERVLALSHDLKRVWSANTTTDRDRKELLQTLVEEVNITLDRDTATAKLVLRWRGGLISDVNVDLWHPRPCGRKTDEETVDLIRRLALHYPDTTIAGILNRQGRRTATGLRFTANHVATLRFHRQIPCYKPAVQPTDGKLVTVTKAANLLGVSSSTVHRWLNDGFIAGEQLTPGAPWQIRVTDQMLSRIVENTPHGYVPMQVATKKLGVSRQTVLQRVKRGELQAVHLRCGKEIQLRINILDDQPSLFDRLN